MCIYTYYLLLSRVTDICLLIMLNRLEKGRLLIVVVIYSSSDVQVYFSVFSHDKEKQIRANVAGYHQKREVALFKKLV